METFSADAMTITFTGFNTHPGFAKGQDGELDQGRRRLHPPPARAASRRPRTTESRDGFVHPYMMNASVEKTSVKFLIRDFEVRGLHDMEATLERLAKETLAAWPGCTVAHQG